MREAPLYAINKQVVGPTPHCGCSHSPIYKTRDDFQFPCRIVVGHQLVGSKVRPRCAARPPCGNGVHTYVIGNDMYIYVICNGMHTYAIGDCMYIYVIGEGMYTYVIYNDVYMYVIGKDLYI